MPAFRVDRPFALGRGHAFRMRKEDLHAVDEVVEAREHLRDDLGKMRANAPLVVLFERLAAEGGGGGFNEDLFGREHDALGRDLLGECIGKECGETHQYVVLRGKGEQHGLCVRGGYCNFFLQCFGFIVGHDSSFQ